jgi:hypothetical protein
MHGLINRAIQCFLRDTQGDDAWQVVAREARLGFDGFEPMLTYDPAVTDAVLAAAGSVLRRPREAILEDFGTYLVSHPNVESLRRLLRFGGATFADFLLGLQDLKGRARLALADLDLPDLDLDAADDGRYRLRVVYPLPGAAHVLSGLIRAMADDYGALVLIEDPVRDPDGAEVIAISVLDARHAAGRRFDLGARPG